MPETLVIVGASLAGGSAAATLRQEGFEGRVILSGAEPQPPYERPPLSKEYLRGESPFENALVQTADFYGEHGIETQFGVRATRVDATEKTLELDGKERIAYDGLLIATGGRNRQLTIRVWTLRVSTSYARWPTATASARRSSRAARRWW